MSNAKALVIIILILLGFSLGLGILFYKLQYTSTPRNQELVLPQTKEPKLSTQEKLIIIDNKLNDLRNQNEEILPKETEADLDAKLSEIEERLGSIRLQDEESVEAKSEELKRQEILNKLNILRQNN